MMDQARVAEYITVAGSASVALVAATSNGFALIAPFVAVDMGLSSTEQSLLTAFGAALLMFSFLGGSVGDSYGFEYAAVVGSLLSLCGYTAMSFARTSWELFITYIMVGLGGGTMVVAALSTAVVVGRSYAISIVALCVSLSIAFANFLQSSVGDSLCHMGFNDDGAVEGNADCWRTDLRIYVVAILGFSLFGVPLMFPAVSKWLAARIVAACFTAEQQRYASLTTPKAGSNEHVAQRSSSSEADTSPQVGSAAGSPNAADCPQEQQHEATPQQQAASSSAHKPPLSPATPLLQAGKALQQATAPSPSPLLGQPRLQLSSAAAPGHRSLSGSARSLSEDAVADGGLRLDGPVRHHGSAAGAGCTSAQFLASQPSYMTRLLSFKESLIVLKEQYFWVLLLADVTAAGVGTYAVTAVPAIVNDVVNPCTVHNTLAECENHPDVALYQGDITVGLVLTLFSVLNAFANVTMPLLAGWLHTTGRVHLHRFWVGTMVATVLLLASMGFLSLSYGTQGSAAAQAPRILRDVYCLMVAFLGFSFGTTLAVFPQIVADGFGSINYGKIFSLVQVGLVGFSVGLPPAADAVANATGGWAYCHLGMAGLLFVSAVLLWPQTPRSVGWRTALKAVERAEVKRAVHV